MLTNFMRVISVCFLFTRVASPIAAWCVLCTRVTARGCQFMSTQVLIGAQSPEQN